MAGRYKILEQLGAGGLGAVFKAYDTQLNRYVAIKRLFSKEELEKGDDQSGGLRQEAASLSALQHPNIVSIFDLASDDEGFFIVMELLEGETLGDWIKKGPMELHEFYDLATQTLEAILTAHHQSILHRDLKPDNIKMLRLPGGRLQVKVLDFGLARQSYGARKMTEDQRGNIMGSIYYMAPEQLMRKPVDGRTDLYAMGCLFYQLLSGHRPFDGATVQEIMERHLNHQVYPLHEIAPSIPGPISAWVMWLINRDSGHRPANAQLALNSLREIHEAGWFKSPEDIAVPVVLESEPAPLPVRITTGHQPTRTTGQQPRVATSSTPRRTSSNIPQAEAPAGFVRTATGALVPAGGPGGAGQPKNRPTPSRPISAARPAPTREEPVKAGIPVWVWPAAAAVLLLGAWMFWPKKAAPTPAPVAAAPTSPPAPTSERPADLMQKGAVLHYIAGQGMDSFAGGNAKPGDLVKDWHDVQPGQADAMMSSFKGRQETCPKYLQEKVNGLKPLLGFLRYEGSQGMLLRVPPGDARLSGYPLGYAAKPGLTVFMLLRPNIKASNQVTCLMMADANWKIPVFLRASTSGEFVLAVGAGSNRREAKVKGRNVSGFNLASIVWDAATNKAVLTVRSQDGTKERGEVDTVKLAALSPINQYRISRDPDEKGSPEEQYSGDVAELVVWPFPMTWEERNLQDWKFSQYYLMNPGSRY